MYIATIPNRNSPPAVLLRESYREGGRVKNRTLANLSKLPDHTIEALRHVLKGERLVAPEEAFEIQRTLPHGHVAAVLGMMRKLKLPGIISSRVGRLRNLVVSMIVSRVIHPMSKSATAQGLRRQTAFSSLGELLGLEGIEDREMYRAMDWLLGRKEWIESKLAERHLEQGSPVLYDMSAVYFEGRKCRLAKLRNNGKGKKNKLQVGIGLLTNHEGCPVGVDVFAGDVGDPSTLKSQLQKLRQRFGLKKIVLVADRGMLTEARIEAELRTDEDLDWITALRAPAIKKLVEQRSFAPELFDDWGMAEIISEDFPGERLIVCKNPILARERSQKRQELLQATEVELDKVKAATEREKWRLKGADQIGLRVGKVLNRFKMAKHFIVDISDENLQYRRNEEKIKAESLLDGFYIVRTSLDGDTMGAEQVVKAYKGLSWVERAFRSLKTIDLKVRPVFHWLETRVRAHVFLCMLAYYIEWHMRRALAPLLYDDEDKQRSEERRQSVVAPAVRSDGAKRKAATKRTEQNEPVHSFRTLLHDLSTLAKNWVNTKPSSGPSFPMYTSPTSFQQKVFKLLGFSYRM
jgi:transposase